MSNFEPSDYEKLLRATQACILWESGSVSEEVKALIHKCDPLMVAHLAVTTRTIMKLRTMPLIMARELARHKYLPKYPKLVSNLLVEVIQRADEMSKFMELYFADNKEQPLSKQVKVGLAKAFSKFNEYDLAKYRAEGKSFSTKDILFLVHAKPSDVTPKMAKYTKAERKGKIAHDFTKGEQLFAKLVEGTLSTPLTWETELSAGKDKKATFTKLMAEKKLGALAFLKNLRGIKDAGVSKADVKAFSEVVNLDRVLPFRFISAARHVPDWKDILEPMMFRCVKNLPKLTGKTVFIVDISGSMGSKLSSKSELNRLDTALALAILAREQCENAVIYATAGNDSRMIHATALVPNCRGFALADAIQGMNATLGGGGIFLTQVMDFVANAEKTADRVLVLTDEQDCDTKCNPDKAKAFGKHNYLINIASNANGIAYGTDWVHITGFSENVLYFMITCES